MTKRKMLFTSQSITNEINEKTNKNENVFIEDMVTGEYYRCYNVTFDENNNMILQVKSLKDLSNGTNDLYMESIE